MVRMEDMQTRSFAIPPPGPRFPGACSADELRWLSSKEDIVAADDSFIATNYVAQSV